MQLNIAMNYGGRDELLRAVKAISNEVAAGALQESDITAEVVSDHLYTAGQPDPDLIIRPSGEYRTSNFLLWQSAYAEYVFMDDILWPDFSTENLEEALDEYARRHRRFGGV
jgi:undecaprenyl diphosphate synthase